MVGTKQMPSKLKDPVGNAPTDVSGGVLPEAAAPSRGVPLRPRAAAAPSLRSNARAQEHSHARSRTSPAARPTPAPSAATDDWPAQVELVLSAIEAGQYTGQNRRTAPRRLLRVRAELRLFSDRADAPAWTLYTRDVHARGLGFITPHRLPLGHGGTIELPVGPGSTIRIPCTLLRCREAAPGWFEGSLYFNRDQPQFG